MFSGIYNSIKSVLVKDEEEKWEPIIINSNKIVNIIKFNRFAYKGKGQPWDYSYLSMSGQITWNKKKIEEYTLGSVFVATKERSILESSLEKKFVLAFDPKLPWIKECL
jgi:hypothetical protein